MLNLVRWKSVPILSISEILKNENSISKFYVDIAENKFGLLTYSRPRRTWVK